MIDKSAEQYTSSDEAKTALVVGRPNAGKTSVFNRLTGHRLKTGNYHGVTVEHAEGSIELEHHRIRLIDLPGTPSLVPHSPDEGLTADAVLNGALGPYQLLVSVVDATRLIEGLYLSLQLIELGHPTLVVINQIDLAHREGIEIDTSLLSASLERGHQVPVKVTAVSAVTGEGFDDLTECFRSLCSLTADQRDEEQLALVPWLTTRNAEESDSPLLSEIRVTLAGVDLDYPSHRSHYLSWLSLSVHETESPISPKIRLLAMSDESLSAERAEEMIVERYQWLDQESTQWLSTSSSESGLQRRPLTERVDSWLLNPLWGSLFFMSLMVMLFQALFVGADPFIGLIEDGVAWLGEYASATLPSGILAEFIVEGLINGVGNVIVFLPQVLILFGLIGLMEDSGYMSRASALTDRVMRKAGLSGRAFVPMLSGFICAVPAILATRTLPQRRDRLLTMMALPLLTCSARLPVYTLLIATLLPDPGTTVGIDDRAWVMVLLYLFATLSAFAAVWVMGKTILKGETPPLLIHLPDYRRPVLKDVSQRLFTRAMVFVKEAGTVIFVGTVILWLLLSFPRLDPNTRVNASPAQATQVSPSSAESESLQLAALRAQSYGGQLGRLMEPALRPLGWDWQVGVGLIGAFAAREVFVSTLGMVYGVGGEVDEESASLRERIRQAKHSDGAPVFTPTSALALLIFFSLACQCLSTLAAVKRETGGYRWPLFMFSYMSALAYGCALAVTWIGRLLS